MDSQVKTSDVRMKNQEDAHDNDANRNYRQEADTPCVTVLSSCPDPFVFPKP